MLIGMIGLVVLALYSNILYYEYLFIKKPKKDHDILSGYRDLVLKKKDHTTFNGVGGSDKKPAGGLEETFNGR